MMKKNLLVITQDNKTAALYTQQLKNMIGHMLDIDYFSYFIDELYDNELDDLYPKLEKADMIVVSCQTIKKRLVADVKDILPEIIVASTTLNNAYLTKLIHLPLKTNALVVTNFRETALAAIELLREYGFTDLNYYPYFEGCRFNKAKLDHIQVAITTGVPYLVPDNIPEVIDIGVRVIDISTMVSLLLSLDLSVNMIDEISEKYIKDLLNLNLKYKETVDKVIELNKQLEAVVNSSEDGIIIVDKKMQIVFMNTYAEKVFSMTNKEQRETELKSIIPDLENALTCSRKGFEKLTSIGEEKVLLKQVPVIIDGDIFGIIVSIKSVKHVKRLEEEVRQQSLETGQIARFCFEDIICKNDKMLKTIETAKAFSMTDKNVIITGESGTGKELFAHSIHQYSKRSKYPFMPINFSSLPESLVESELFGYEGGAFTGAKKQGSPGLFELAHKGTLFLDEIGDASLSVQSNLLRVLEESRVRRISGKDLLPVDVRIIAATNKDLKKLIAEGKFREDLFYRLYIFHLEIPPLRERQEDISLLVRWFMKKESTFSYSTIPNSLLEYLNKYDWPGNIRQLNSAVLFLSTLLQRKDLKVDLHEELMRYLSYTPGGNEEQKMVKSDNIFFHGNKEEFKAILTILAEEQDSSSNIGRTHILEKSRHKGNGLTDARIRRLLQILKQCGYVHVGKTRQGTRITKQGQNFLEGLD